MDNPLDYAGEMTMQPYYNFNAKTKGDFGGYGKSKKMKLNSGRSKFDLFNNGMDIIHQPNYNFKNPLKSSTHRIITELKVFDTQNPSGGYPLITRVGGAAGEGITLIFCPQSKPGGSSAYDINNRVSRKTVITSIFLRGEVLGGIYQLPFLTTAAQAFPYTFARILIVYDREPPQTTSLPTVPNIISSSSNLSYDLKNNDQIKRFYFIMDKIYMIGGVRSDLTTNNYIMSEGRQSFLLEKYIRCNLETIFNSSTAAQDIRTINTGAVYLVTIGNNASVTNGNPIANIDIRTRFTDCN